MVKAARKMAKPPRRRVAVKEHKPASGTCTYLGCFTFEESGDHERHGSFQLVVDATSPRQALERCRLRLQKLRATTPLFDDPIKFYIEGIVKLSGSRAAGLLVNWESGDRPHDPKIRITCLIPEQEDTSAVAYHYEPEGNDKSEPDDRGVPPFLEFGPRSSP
jgi:hypothetical protein